jgi:PAS domain S-box-containing protein
MNALLRAILATVTDPVWIVRRDKTVAEANTAYASLAAKADAFEPLWRELAERVFAGRHVAADLRTVVDNIERSYTIIANMAGDLAVFTARDVTDVSRTKREDQLELAVTRIFAGGRPVDETLQEVLEFICESDDWDCAVVWLLDANEKGLAVNAIWSRSDIDASKFRERIAELRFERGHGVPGRAWKRDELVWVADLFDETGYTRADAAARAGLHGAAAVPLRDGERFVGVLEILTRAIRPISEQRRRALVRAGESLGRLIVRRQLQQMIERKGQEWSLTFDAIELPIFITRLDGTIARVNRAARDLIGGGFLDILGRNIAIAEHEPWKTLGDIVRAVRDSRVPCTAQIHAGERYWDVNASSYTSASENEERAIIVLRDTTELVQLEESVRRGEQLAALGELVAGVAHEVRNPIFGIGLTVDALQQMLPEDPELAELVSVLRTWLDRLNRLMENLLAYGKTWTLSLRLGDLAAVLRPVIDGCQQIASRSSIEIDVDLEEGLMVLMDATRLAQAFENVVVNAVQHSRPGQRVQISARALRDGDHSSIQCDVRDHGPGFDPTVLPEKIFQPFFTKRRGGTGLGLAIVQRIVDEHGGTINAGNAENGGAIVTMRFPAYHDPRQQT